jgi:DHA2 family multidrug resistance protein
MRFVPDTGRRARVMDWTGLALLGLGIAGIQYFLDRGNTQDWLAAVDIRVAAIVGSVATLGFIAWSIRRGARALFDVRIFTDRNFGMSCLVMAALGVGMFGGLVLQPILLESLLGYPIVTTGLLMAPRGIATAAAMIVVGRLVNRIDTRYLIGAGMVLSAIGSFAMTRYSLEIDTFWIVWPALFQGLGLGLIFVPLATIAYATLPRQRMAEAAGIFSLVRTIGAAAGISIVTTLMTRQTQVVWNELGANVTRFNHALADYLRPLHLSPTDPKALALIAQQVGQQAAIIAIVDVFYVTAWSFVAMLPLVLLLRTRKGSQPPPPAME